MTNHHRLYAKSIPHIVGAVLVSLAFLYESGAKQPDTSAIRRFAVLIGANDGGRERVQLRYATSDAQNLRDVLMELGGVDSRDLALIENPDRASINTALNEMAAKMKASAQSGVQNQLFVYYSGHSDEDGLLLFGHRYPYREFKERIGALPAELRIVILDSCASGSFTRLKGGKHRAPFLMDTGTRLEGHAFLTSSSADEVSQESDSIRGSFFTHYLTSGMRGAADVTGDGKVTLNEAYHFAFYETLARTESSQGGAQHASYEIQLTGSGDLVMTDLRTTRATLHLDEQLAGRMYIRTDDGQLVVELRKLAGRVVDLGVQPGTYKITLDQDGTLSRATVVVVEGQPTTLQQSDFNVIEGEQTVFRGDRSTPDTQASLSPEPSVDVQQDTGPEIKTVPVNLGLVPYVNINDAVGDRVLNYFSLNLLVGHGAILKGAEVGGLMNWREEDIIGLQAAGLFNLTENMVKGAQVSGLGNYTSKLVGAQFGFLANIVTEDVVGLQFGGFRYSQTLKGASFGEIYGLTRDWVTGAQFSVVGNYAGGEVKGAQIAVVSNVASNVTGVQFGLVNVAEGVRGAQIGLVNISEHIDGASVGIVNYSEDGYIRFELWSSDTAIANLGVKFGTPYFYGILALGIEPLLDADLTVTPGLGFGGHIPAPAGFAVDIDLMGYGAIRDTTYFEENRQTGIAKLRILVSYRFFERFAIFGGPSLNVLYSRQVALGDFSYTSLKTRNKPVGERDVTIGVGYVVGLSF